MKRIVSVVFVFMLCITSLFAYNYILDGVRFRVTIPVISFDKTFVDFYESHNGGGGDSLYSSIISPYVGLDVSYAPDASFWAVGGNASIAGELWSNPISVSRNVKCILRGELAGTVSFLTPVMLFMNSLYVYGDASLSAGVAVKTNFDQSSILPLVGLGLSMNIGGESVRMCFGCKGTAIIDAFSPQYQRSISWNLLTQIGIEWRI